MNQTKILLTSGAGPGVSGIVRALRTHPFRKLHVIVGDVDKNECAGFMLADQNCELPMADRPGYLDKMLDICRSLGIDILLPVFSGELDVLAANLDAFRRIGTNIVLPETNVVLTANSKGSFFDLMRTKGVSVPEYRRVRSIDELIRAAEDLGYPGKTICLKPDRGAGNRGFHILAESHDRFRSFFEIKPDNTVCSLSEVVAALDARGARAFPDILAMEFLEGQEYGADILAEKGRVLAIFTRRKLPPEKLGMHFRVEFVSETFVEDIVKSVISALKMSFIASIDVRCDSAGVPHILEMNPRPGAYIGMACAETNILAAAVDMLIGDKQVDLKRYRTGQEVGMGVRYFNDFVVYRDKSTCAF